MNMIVNLMGGERTQIECASPVMVPPLVVKI